MKFRLAVLPLLLLALILAACDTTLIRPGAEEREAIERRATALRSEGRYRESAQEFLRLARSTDPPEAHAFAYEAAVSYTEEGDMAAAKSLLDEKLPEELEPELERKRTALRAEIALIEKHPFDALLMLTPELKSEASAALALRIGELRARALHQSGQYLSAVRERIDLEEALVNFEAVNENRRRLWASVSRLFPAELRSAMPSFPNTLSGWLELGVIASELLMQPDALVENIDRWRTRYPGHPASAGVIPSLIEVARSGTAPPTKVALLLPLQGSFKKAAEAVRDGFIAAWLEDADNPRRPEIMVRSVGRDDVWPAYQQVVSSGAEFVVGPLERSAVDTIASADLLPVPTLALNYATRDARAPQLEDDVFATGGVITHGDPEKPGEQRSERLFQFALSPEDEARTVAKRAWFDGRSKAAVIAPESDWGRRVADAFVTEWERLGGEVLDVRFFPSDAPDLSGPVKALLDIDDSERRRRALTRAIGERVEFEPRRRQDVDFLFMVAFPVQARQLKPLLKFHRAGDVPVYATSHVYAGMPDPESDADENGIMFPDIPWTVAPDKASQLRPKVVSAWPGSLPAYLRLYAFGADAYGLVPRLDMLKERRYIEFAGATGGLSVDARNRVERRLIWSRFENGVPRPLNRPAPGDAGAE